MIGNTGARLPAIAIGFIPLLKINSENNSLAYSPVYRNSVEVYRNANKNTTANPYAVVLYRSTKVRQKNTMSVCFSPDETKAFFRLVPLPNAKLLIQPS